MKQNLIYLAIIGLSLGCQSKQTSYNEAAVTQEPTKPSIEGAWKLVETSYTNDDTSFVHSPFRSIILYTNKFYSVEIAREDRPSWPDRPDGEDIPYDQLSNTYSNLTSNSGKYEIRGDSIIYNIIVAKSPNLMNDIQKIASRFTLDGDKLTTYSYRPFFSGINLTSTYRRLN